MGSMWGLGRPVREAQSRSQCRVFGALAQVFEGRVVRGDPNACGHIIQASGGTGANRQTINFSTERVVGNGSFGVVFQATCLETGETVRSPPRQPRPATPPAARHPRRPIPLQQAAVTTPTPQNWRGAGSRHCTASRECREVNRAPLCALLQHQGFTLAKALGANPMPACRKTVDLSDILGLRIGVIHGVIRACRVPDAVPPLLRQVAIKKVLQDKRFKNRELQIMKMMGHPNVVDLKHCFYTTTDKDEARSALELASASTATPWNKSAPRLAFKLRVSCLFGALFPCFLRSRVLPDPFAGDCTPKGSLMPPAWLHFDATGPAALVSHAAGSYRQFSHDGAEGVAEGSSTALVHVIP